MPPDPRVHVGVCAIVEHLGHVLLLQRGGGAGYAIDGVGTWGAPGGWLEGESPEQCAVREVREETGVLVEPIAQDGWTWNERESGGEWVVTLHVRCGWVAGEPVVMEPTKCPVDEVHQRPLFAPLAAYWSRRLVHAR